MKKKKLLAYLLVLTFLFSSINISVYGATTAGVDYEIAVAMDPAQISVDLSAFEADLKAEMISQYAAQHAPAAITDDDIQISFLKPNTVTTQVQSAWNIYDHYFSPTYFASSKTDQDKADLLTLAGRTGQPFYYYAETSGIQNNGFYTTADEGTDYVYARDKHIYADGQRVTFLGYSSPAYNDFMIYPDENQGDKTVEFSVYLDGVSTHTLDGAGYLVNTSIDNAGLIDGYLVFYDYSGSSTISGESIYLYKLTNVNATTLHDSGSALNSLSGSGVTKILGPIIPAVDGKTGTGTSVKDIRISVINNTLKFYEKNGENTSDTYHEVISQALDSGTGYGFGPYVDYLGHGCPELTTFTYDNLQMSSSETKTFEEKILETAWNDGAVHAMINVDDSGIVNFTDDNARTEMLNRLIDRNVRYIAWGDADKTEELSFIKDNNKEGIYVDTSTTTNNVIYGDGTTPDASAADYAAQVSEIANYLVGLSAPDLAENPVAVINYDGTAFTSGSTDPDGDTPLTQYWSLKEADATEWTLADDSADAVTELAALLAGADKNILVQLVVKDSQNNYSEPAVLYLSNQATVKPLAQFELPDAIDLETAVSTEATVDNTSYDPYVGSPARTLSYVWSVTNEMNQLVLTSTDTEPTFDFAGLAAGRYDVTLTVTANDGTTDYVSNSVSQSILLADAIAPTLMVDLQGNSTSAQATIQIIDNGSGPDSYRIITTSGPTTITGPWLTAKAQRSITKIYNFNPSTLDGLAVEVKDGSGNTQSYPIDFSLPMVAYAPNGGNIYTNFTYDEDVSVTISSLASGVTISDWYYQWTTSTDPVSDITVTGTHVTAATTATIAQPATTGSYYLHVSATNSNAITSTDVSAVFNVSATSDEITNLHVTGISGGTGIALAWTQPTDAVAQKMLYSADGGTTWLDASTSSPLDGTSNSAVITGLNTANEYMFKLKVDGGTNAGESNIAYWENLIDYAMGDSASSVTKNITLTKSTSQGATVTWTSSDNECIDQQGNVFRPRFYDGNQTVTMSATVQQGGLSYVVDYELEVIAALPTDEEAVAADKAALAIIYAPGDSAISVTQNLTLPTTATNASTITWASNTLGTITAGGLVTRPDSSATDEWVQLTATITKNAISETRIFVVKVLKTQDSDADLVAADKALLEIGYTPGDTQAFVTRDVTLATSLANGSTVTWTSNDETVITTDGDVTRPDASSADTEVTLTATISKGGSSDTKTFVLTVIQTAADYTQAQIQDASTDIAYILYADGDDASHVTRDLLLISSTGNGSDVTWSSDSSEVDLGGNVSRPAFGNSDAAVQLTATVSNDGFQFTTAFTFTTTFDLTVLAEEDTSADSTSVNADKEALGIVYAIGDSAASVTQNIGLLTNGSNGSTISWATSMGTLIDSVGNVFRPLFEFGNQVVELTATIVKNSVSTTKDFALTVIALYGDDNEAITYDKAQLEIGYAAGDDASSVTQNITLPLLGESTSTITWISDLPGTIDAAGNVIRPAEGSSDQTVVLTATISKAGLTETKVFEVVVKAISVNPDQTAVDADKAALEIGYAQGDDENSVTQNVSLVENGTNGSTITWSSDTPGTLDGEGNVIRPAYGSEDITVTLTATIIKNGVTETKVFEVTVKASAVNPDSQDVEDDKADLEIVTQEGESLDNVTKDLTLPTTGGNGTTITWESSAPEFIDDAGKVNQPSASQGDQDVTLTATIEKNGLSETKIFQVRVKARARTNRDEAIATPAPAITESGTEVIVNGKVEIAGTETKQEVDGKTVVEVDVNADTIIKKIETVLQESTTSDENLIEVPVVSKGSDQLSVTLTGDVIKKMEDNRFELAVQADGIDYIIPAQEIGIDKVAQELGISADSLEKIEIEIHIDQVETGMANQIIEDAQGQGYTIMFPPVEFSVVAVTTYTDGSTKEVRLSRFNQYVERVLEIPAGIDPSKITTGIVYNPDGTFSHIPTEVFEKDGIYYARLSSLTNSDYSIIWNPITVASVQQHWSQAAVDDMASRLVVKDPETFAPDAAITRGDFAEYIAKAIGVYRTGIAAEQFSDVSIDDAQADAITAAAAYGIINGYPDGTFRPEGIITRQEAMVMFARAMEVVALTSKDDTRVSGFADADGIAGWALEDVTAAVGSGVFNGRSEDMLEVTGTFTYAEAATAVRNMLVEAGLINE